MSVIIISNDRIGVRIIKTGVDINFRNLFESLNSSRITFLNSIRRRIGGVTTIIQATEKNGSNCITRNAIKTTFQLQNQTSRPVANRTIVMVEKKHATFNISKTICVKSCVLGKKNSSNTVRGKVDTAHE